MHARNYAQAALRPKTAALEKGRAATCKSTIPMKWAGAFIAAETSTQEQMRAVPISAYVKTTVRRDLRRDIPSGSHGAACV